MNGQNNVESPLREKGIPARAERLQDSIKGCGLFRMSSNPISGPELKRCRKKTDAGFACVTPDAER